MAASGNQGRDRTQDSKDGLERRRADAWVDGAASSSVALAASAESQAARGTDEESVLDLGSHLLSFDRVAEGE